MAELMAVEIVGHSRDEKECDHTVRQEGHGADDTNKEPASPGSELPLDLFDEI